ncbi:TPA_asm: hypothetical protein [Trichoplax MELD virus]|nr:TPA_asm: hypothetical protein [Trichoplax MELD virus]
MPFDTIETVEDRKRVINTFLKNRSILKQQQLNQKLNEQSFQESTTKLQKPVVKKIEEVQKKEDNRQDKLLEQLQKNQEALSSNIESLSSTISQRQSEDSSVQQWLDSHSQDGLQGRFNPQEIETIKKNGFDPTLSKPQDIKSIRRKINSLTAQATHASRKNNSVKYQIVKQEQLTLSKYLAVVREKNLQQLDPIREEGSQSGYGISIKKNVKHTMRDPYSLANNSYFGDLYIDPNKLIQMKLEAYDHNGRKVLSRKFDNTFYDLLTKRYNPKKTYSDKAQKLFTKLVELSGVPMNSRSMKTKIGRDNKSSNTEKIQYKHYSNPDQLCNRLEVILGAKEAGNSNQQLNNEAINIIDILYNDNIITKEQYEKIHNSFI